MTKIEEYKHLHPYCEACGAMCWGDPHHIRTQGAGGTDDPDNLLRLCVCCHLYKLEGLGMVLFMRLFPWLQSKILKVHPKLTDKVHRIDGDFQY